MNNKNELYEKVPRLGWFNDDLPEEITPSTPAVLMDTGRRIELQIPWLRTADEKYDQIENWFMSSEGFDEQASDEPDSHPLPAEILFNDEVGSILLLGCKSVGFQTRGIIGKGSIEVEAAIMGAKSKGYSQINGMRSYILGLEAWVDTATVGTQISRGEDGKPVSFCVSGNSQAPIPLPGKHELSVHPEWKVVDKLTGEKRIEEYAFVETRTQDPLDWREHLEEHGRVRDLVRVSVWKPVGYNSIRVQLDADPVKDFEDSKAARWGDLKSHLIVGYDGERIESKNSLFTFKDIGVDGYARWQQICTNYSRAINPLMALLNESQSSIEMRLTQAAVGLEAMALQMAKEAGVNRNKRNGEKIQSRLARIQASVPIDFLDDHWPQECADSYNGIKHANRTMPDFELIYRNYTQCVLLFRLWVAARLGISPDLLKSRVEMDSKMQWLIQNNGAKKVKLW